MVACSIDTNWETMAIIGLRAYTPYVGLIACLSVQPPLSSYTVQPLLSSYTQAITAFLYIRQCIIILKQIVCNLIRNKA